MHVHSHSSVRNPVGVLRFALLLTLGYIVLTTVAGIRAHSLALLSEAGHNVSDFLALALSLGAVYLQARPPNPHKTFGYQRAGVLAAFVNAAALVVIAGLIFYEAWQRLINPRPVHALGLEEPDPKRARNSAATIAASYIPIRGDGQDR